MAIIDPRRIPIIGSDVYQVGQVYDMLVQPCGPSPSIVVTAFFQAIPTLIWAIAKPDTFDLVQDRFGRHHKRVSKKKFRLFDVTRGNLPLPRGLATIGLPIQNALERIGFYFLVADATTDFLVNWTSLAYVFSGCTPAGLPYAQQKQPPGTVFYGNLPLTEAIGSMTDVSFNTWFASGTTINAHTVGPKWIAGGFQQAKSGLAGPEATVSRVYIRADQGPNSAFYDLGQTKNSDGLVGASGAHKEWSISEGPTTYTMWAERSAGHFAVQGAWMTCSGSTGQGLLADP